MQNQANTESAMRSASLHTGSASSYRGGELAGDLLIRLFQRLPLRMTVRLWNGDTLQVGGADAQARDSAFSLVFRTPEAVYSAVLGRDPLRLAEAYFRGDMDIEGDFSPPSNSRTTCRRCACPPPSGWERCFPRCVCAH